MYAKSTRPSAKREVRKDRSAKRDDQIARPRRAQTCERSAPWADFFSFSSGHSILSKCVAQISNKSKGNRRISEERQVLDAQLCASSNSIPMDLIQIYSPFYSLYCPLQFVIGFSFSLQYSCYNLVLFFASCSINLVYILIPTLDVCFRIKAYEKLKRTV